MLHETVALGGCRPEHFLGNILQSKSWYYSAKPENEADLRYMWKYMHFRSHMAYKQKRAVMIAALKKTQALASNPVTTIYGALKKISEFERLGYPNAMKEKKAPSGPTTVNPNNPQHL